MSTEQTFSVAVDGIEYDVSASTRNNNDTFQITTNNGALTVTDSFGECNPLRALWADWRYQYVRGAARDAMEIKCIKAAVAHEVEAHLDFSRQLIEDDLDAEVRDAHERANALRLRFLPKLRNQNFF